MNLFLTLKKKQRPTSFERSEEMAFFLANAGMLSDLQYFAPLMKAQSPFQIERANIVLRSLYAKQTIDKTLKSAFAKSEGLGEREKAILIEEAVAPVLKKLPYHWFEDQKIYLPFFSKSLNRIYGQEWEKLANKPYKRMAGNFEAVLIDPFDYYGDDLFDSLFTRLAADTLALQFYIVSDSPHYNTHRKRVNRRNRQFSPVGSRISRRECPKTGKCPADTGSAGRFGRSARDYCINVPAIIWSM